jgi:hypothetical protein
MPEWVHVWVWLRFARSVLDPLPQQNLPNAISDEGYEHHRKAWLRAGAPMITQQQLVGAMSGIDPDDVPF